MDPYDRIEQGVDFFLYKIVVPAMIFGGILLAGYQVALVIGGPP